MELRKMTLMLTALGAVSVLLTGCPDGGRETLRCEETTDCLDNEICHPDAKVCVQTCTATTDCPDSAKNCEALSATNTQQICKCSTTALCGQDERVEAELVCLTASQGFPAPLSDYEVCVPKCTADTDCATGQTCDTTLGVCRASGGTTPGACTIGSCGINQVCNTSTGACIAGPACTGSGQGTCAYGQYCSVGTCNDAPVAAATCQNFSQNRPAWSAASNGPVIYDTELAAYEPSYVYCDQSGGQSDAFIIRLKAYRPGSDWPSTRAELSGFFYVTTGSVQTDIVNSGLLVPQTGYNRNPNNPKDAEFLVYLCRPPSQTLQAAFFFTGGNPVCEQYAR